MGLEEGHECEQELALVAHRENGYLQVPPQRFDLKRIDPSNVYPVPPWKTLTPEERRKAVVILRESPPPASAKRVEKIFPPKMPSVPAFEVHEGPLSIESPPILKTPMGTYAAATRPIAKEAGLKTDVAALLASNAGLRDAIILREILGPPRSLQALDLL